MNCLADSKTMRNNDPQKQKKMGDESDNVELSRFPTLLQAVDKMKELGGMGLPVTAMNLVVYVWEMVSLLCVERLGSLELVGGALAIGISNITGYSMLYGLATGMDPVGSQAFGSRNSGLMSLALQLTIVILLSASIPISHLWLNLETIMLSLGQDPQICRYALPGLLPNSLLQPLRIFLRSQGITAPMMWSSLLAVAAHVPLTWFLVFVLRIGVSGAAIANMMVVLLAYVVYRSLRKATWSGWSRESIKDWWGSIIQARINLGSCYLAFTLKLNNALRLDLSSLTAIAFLLLYSCGGGVEGRQFTLVNKCSYVVWPAIQPDAGHVVIARGGMYLESQTAKTIETPAGWSGRIWGRNDCTFDQSGNHGYCSTGDCGGVLFCNGAGFAPPATIVEITLSAIRSAPDLYDVSLVDGYNLPVIISPSEGGSGQCRVAGCPNDLNVVCPHVLQVVKKGSVVGCNSACFVFNSPKYCCTGRHGELITCRSNTLSELFKNACPSAYSYASDKASRLVTCSGGHNYIITFCPRN